MNESIAELIQLPPHQRAEALADMRRAAGSCATAVVPTRAPLPAVARDVTLPASYLQEQMLFLHLLQPTSSAYHIPFAFDFDGDLDVGAVREAWRRLVVRHEILRSGVLLRRGKVVLVVAPDSASFDLDVVDLSEVSDLTREVSLDEWLHDLVHRPFAVSEPPLVRIGVAALTPTRHVLAGVAHHAILDGLSLNALAVELVDSYRAVLAAEPATCPPRVQYADFAHHQRATLTSERIEKLMRPVRAQLAGAPLFEPPTDYPRPAVQDFAGDMLAFELSEELDRAVHRCCRSLGATPFMVLLASYLAALASWSGQYDITVGTSVSGRDSSELRAMLGPLLNVAPLRPGDFRGRSVGRLVLDIRELTARAIGETELPLGRLVSMLAPPRDASRNPVYQTMFDLNECGPASREVAPGLAMAFHTVHLDVSQMDIAVVMDQEEGRLRGRFEFRTSLFERRTVERLCTEFVNVVSDFVSDPSADAEALVARSRQRAGWSA